MSFLHRHNKEIIFSLEERKAKYGKEFHISSETDTFAHIFGQKKTGRANVHHISRKQKLTYMETFWNTIAQYNESTWWAQILITAAGILLTALLYRRPTVWAKRSMKIYMVFLNGWIALVYYASTRHAQLHYVLSAFWGTVALIWLWNLFTGYTPFERNPKYPMLAGVLYAMPFLYPLLSWARGMEFPMMTTTVMPCSVAAFTIGLLLAFSRKSQSARHPLPLPLGAHRLLQSVCVQDSRRPAAGKRHRTCHLPVLQELHSPKPAQGNETERTPHELVPDSDVHRYRGIPKHHALSRGRKINGPTHVFITVCPYNNTL